MIELNSEVLGEFAKRGLSINEGIASGLEGSGLGHICIMSTR